MTPAERKKAQRQRDRIAGWAEVTVKVDRERVQEVRDFAASLPAPPPPNDPAQLSMLEQLDAILAGDVSQQAIGEKDQGSLF